MTALKEDGMKLSFKASVMLILLCAICGWMPVFIVLCQYGSK